jgi:SAM-dependent methyltransferase
MSATVAELGAAVMDAGPIIKKETDPYFHKHLDREIKSIFSYLTVYATIILRVLPKNPAALKDFNLLDYGGGMGFLSLLARRFGVGRVTYMDVSRGATATARKIADLLGLDYIDYICPPEALLAEVSKAPPSMRSVAASPSEESPTTSELEDSLFAQVTRPFSAVVSNDVLEHIYDLNRHFAHLKACCLPGSRLYLQTGANPYCFPIRRRLEKIQKRRERDILYGEREGFIRKLNGELTEQELSTAARAMRGLDKRAIRGALLTFTEKGILPVPANGTNTCHISGWWIERLMKPSYVLDLMGKHGFRGETVSCYYGSQPGRPWRNALKTFLNILSNLSTPMGLLVNGYGVLATRV